MSATTRTPFAAAVVAGGTLPFTGFPLWAVALVGFSLLVAGFGLRRFRKEA
jgi:hypothetical protein